MKRILNLTLLLCALSFTQMIGQIRTPAASPMSTLTQAVGLGEISLEYSRPSKKGRDIFGANGLVPADKIWRTGANQISKITLSDDMMIEGKEVKAGSYGILTKPGKSTWAVHFYEYDGGNWSSYVEKTPAVAVNVTAVNLPFTVETFTMMVGDIKSNGATLSMMWDDVMVPIKLSTEVDKKVMASIDRVLAGPSTGDYYAAGSYYHDSGKDLNKALKWVQMATKVGEPRYWQVRKESLILADLGRYTEAVKSAKKSLELAKAAGNDDYVKMNTESIAMWAKK